MWKRAALAGVFVVALVSLVGAFDEEAPGGQAVHVFLAPISDADLTLEVPVIVVGNVVSRERLRLADDPYLPTNWQNDPEAVRAVDDNPFRTKWDITVTSVVKGEAPSRLWAVVGEGVDTQIGPPGGSDFDPQVGDTAQLWLVPDPWFGGDHYLLVRAKQGTRN